VRYKGPFHQQKIFGLEASLERSIAWAGTNRRSAKDYESKTTHATAWFYSANIRRLTKLT